MPSDHHPRAPLLRACWMTATLTARLLVHPALEHPHVADVGAEHDVEGVARERHQADHAVERDIAEHPRRDVPGRAERARLAHQPQRDRGRDDVADHRDQPDQAVDAVTDIGAGHDEGDVEQFRQRIEPRQPLLAGEIAERVGGGSPEIEPEALELGTAAGLGNFAARPGRSRDHGPAPAPGKGVRCGRASAQKYRRLTWSSDGNAKRVRKLRQNITALTGSLPRDLRRVGKGAFAPCPPSTTETVPTFPAAMASALTRLSSHGGQVAVPSSLQLRFCQIATS